MGTPDFAKNILQGLVESAECEVVVVYTREDAVRGRGKKLVPSPVKQFAVENNIPVETPKNFNDEDIVVKLANYKPDFIVVAAYGLILPKPVLDIPKYECLNVHGSLLPKWRGAAPVQRAILAGDAESGFTIMRIGEGLDDGDMYSRHAFDITDMNTTEVLDEISKRSVPELLKTMHEIESGEAKAECQDESQATFADKIEKRELWYKNGDSDETWYRKILASTPESPAKCKIAGRVVTITKIECGPRGNRVNATSKSSVGPGEIERVRPDGKNEMSFKDFVNGLQNVDIDNLEFEEIE